MALGNQSTISAQNEITQQFRLGTAQGQTKVFYPTVCTEIMSTRKDETYAFAGAMPAMRKWLGERVYNKLRAGRFTIANEPWELSLEVLRDDIDDDNLGMYSNTAMDMGIRAMQHPDKLLITAIEAGDSAECFDGQSFFDSDHVWGDSGALSNLMTYAAATGTTPTAAEFKAAFNASVERMLSYKDDQGENLNQGIVEQLSSLVCVVPLALRMIAHEALDVPYNAAGATNLVLDKPRIVCMPGLSNAAKFFTFDSNGTNLPFVFQKRKPLRAPVWIDDPKEKFIQMVTDARYNLGYFAWWKAIQTTFT